MKKVVCILMMVIMFGVMMISANAETTHPTCNEALELLNEWKDLFGYEAYTENGYNDGEYFNYIGTLNVHSFEKETGMKATVENWEKWAKSEYTMKVLETKEVGQSEGNSVYFVTAEAEEPLFDNHTKVHVIFMMCENW